MKINKQSNAYTICYIVVMVLVVGTALALTAMSLRGRQQANADADKMRQILASAHIEVPQGETVAEVFEASVVGQPVFDAKGNRVEGLKAFDINVEAESAKPDAERLLPVYIVNKGGEVKFIVPLHGAGLWGPIWGYIAFNDTPRLTVYGAYFDHQGETPGLGAEITKPEFTDRFEGKSPFAPDGRFLSIAVLKKGLKPQNGEEYVDAVSGGTITSKGVGAMLDNCLRPYQPVFKNLIGKEAKNG